MKQYLDVFCVDFCHVVQDENVIENFSQRVKSLTIPLRTADFNIYDPDNDVHWNLLIETFTRELNTIEKSSLQILNNSFKNLRLVYNFFCVCAVHFFDSAHTLYSLYRMS